MLKNSFPLYFLDHQNSAAALASWLGSGRPSHADLVARFLFVFAAVLLIVAALLRTWASAYLHAGVVYATEVKTTSLVADGPYRQVRNPLYLANVLMVIKRQIGSSGTEHCSSGLSSPYRFRCISWITRIQPLHWLAGLDRGGQDGFYYHGFNASDF